MAVALCLLAANGAGVGAQEYSSVPVVVSTDKVRHNGKVYYSHIVQERQTLFSISKAYNVTLAEIYEANPELDLEKSGLKKDQILRIPVKGSPASGSGGSEGGNEETGAGREDQTEGNVSAGQDSVSETASKPAPAGQEDVGKAGEHTFYRVKWFDDLETIAAKFKVSKESIMGINSLVSEKLKRRQLLKIPKFPELWEKLADETKSRKDSEAEQGERVDNDTDKTNAPELGEPGIFDGLFNRGGQHRVTLSLLLPLNARGKANESILDFYSGALLAAKAAGAKGIDLDLDVHDISGGDFPTNSETYSKSSFCIGPVSGQDVLKAVRYSGGTGWIVSPLDQKVEALADTTDNLVQAPSPTSAQIKDMVDWVESDTRPEDRVILISQKGVERNAYATSVIKAVNESGLPHSSLSFTILEGRDIFAKLSSMASQQGVTRVVMASDSEAFATEVVRNLYMMTNTKEKELKPVLYCTSRIRSFETIDLEQLHKINLHVSLSYHVDYDAPEVNEFVMEYRALFKTEPNQFAFQGYDLTNYFAALYSKHGENWERAAGSFDFKGLQTDFNLRKSPAGGYVNNAVRRIVYKTDYSVIPVE